MLKVNWILYIVLVFVTGCTEAPEKEKPDVDWTKENSTDLGKEIAVQEEIDIKLFLEMHKDWKITKTGSGLRYYIYEHGTIDTGYTPQPGNMAEIEYVVSLLDGTECYRTEDDEYEEIIVDNSQIETGMQEGVKKLTIGDRAKFIIPSHLGHGLVGDMDKIPPLNTLVVDVRLIGIEIR